VSGSAVRAELVLRRVPIPPQPDGLNDLAAHMMLTMPGARLHHLGTPPTKRIWPV